MHISVFDYMILGSFWSFALFMLVYARLVPLVWKAQNSEILSWGYTRARIAFSAFQSRFLICVLSLTLLLVVFTPAYRLTVPLMHLFFVPQILSNALYGYRNVLASKVYVPIGTARLLLAVSSKAAVRVRLPSQFLGVEAGLLDVWVDRTRPVRPDGDVEAAELPHGTALLNPCDPPTASVQLLPVGRRRDGGGERREL